jgi:hypothetical protein
LVPGALPRLDSGESKSSGCPASSLVSSCGARFVVVARSPKDVCTSCFYHAWSPAQQGWPFEAWAACWLDGATPSGRWVDWHAGWRRQTGARFAPPQAQPRVLMLTYEALASPDEVVRLAALRTLGAFVLQLPRAPGDAQVVPGGGGFEALVRRVDHVCRFDAMKAQATAATTTAAPKPGRSGSSSLDGNAGGLHSSRRGSLPNGAGAAGHLRHGKAGNWTAHFSLALAARFDDQCGEEARLCGL